MESFDGFLVHWWSYQGQLRASGRLVDGRSFAVMVPDLISDWVVSPDQSERAASLLKIASIPYSTRSVSSFSGDSLVSISLAAVDWKRAEALFLREGIRQKGTNPRPADDFLMARKITGAVRIEGRPEPARRVDLFFRSPVLTPSENTTNLVWASIDIETARDGMVRSIAIAQQGRDQVLFLPDFENEAALLRASNDLVRAFDPDVVTGWNVLDFDFAHLDERFRRAKIPFLWGRTDENVRVRKKPGARTSAFLPGRQVVDAMRIARGSGTRFEDQTLGTVASHVLGMTKTVELRGEEKLVELDRMYINAPQDFCDYCLQDAKLVLGILEKTGLGELTVRRASLTGVPLDLAWTSIPVFERIYALELSARNILPPDASDLPVSGAAGGMVLLPKAGLFSNVLLFDFRSLYPSIIRTFGIDPLGHEIVGDDPVVAPNGAKFSREPGILPALIARYFANRESAQARGDETASYVYKILMNSFYGVLGSAGCVYGRTELAGAITGFGRYCLEFTKDWFEARKMPVLYGDTDSVFVLSDLESGESLAKELNRDLADLVGRTWKVQSYLNLRCEKRYKRFLIPPMRHMGHEETLRGRAKGYAGWVEKSDGRLEIEVKGMEAARSDWTPLARRFQMELLERLFRGASRAELEDWKNSILTKLHLGDLDTELVYRKILRRPAEDYTGNTPPQVKAARLLGWTGRRGSVEYIMTSQGPRPIGIPGAPPDESHYREHQLRPIWDSLLEAAGMDPGGEWSTQLELGLD